MKDRQWFEVLPEPFNQDLEVVCVMKPDGWKAKLVNTTDGKFSLGVMTGPNENMRGLQVRDVNYHSWVSQDRIMTEYRI